MSTETFSDDFVITARQVADGVVLVAIAGDLDFETVPKAMAFLTEATATGPEHLILDLAGVAFMASSGLALLIIARANEEGIQGYLHLLGVIGMFAFHLDPIYGHPTTLSLEAAYTNTTNRAVAGLTAKISPGWCGFWWRRYSCGLATDCR